jgi:hypothetical protein
MFPLDRFVILSPPSHPAQLARRPARARRVQFHSGTFNQRLVRDVLAYNGVEWSAASDCALFWGTPAETQSLAPVCHLQKINHFPNSKLTLGDKAMLTQILQSHPSFPQFRHFFPTTYLLPNDQQSLQRVMRARPRTLFIAKPPNGSCGHGIKVISYREFFTIPPGSVVSNYITRPLCIDGFKCDLRIYVLVTCFSPLRAYLARDGLARFATESYTVATGSLYCHLTNATLNKKSQRWVNGAFKWTLTELFGEIEHRWNYSREQLMRGIEDIVKVTLALVQPSMVPRERRTLTEPYFELYGFDILLDREFKPHLLEINTMPSLNTDEDVDFDVKAPLVAQALSIVGLLDLSLGELLAADSEFVLPPDGIAGFDALVAQLEVERNRLSGGGFTPLFPNPSDPLNALLVPTAVNIPRYHLQVASPHSAPFVVAEEERLAVLCNFLLDIEAKFAVYPADPKLVSRVHCFLVAQGYKAVKGVVAVRRLLAHFIPRLQSWTTEEAMQKTSAANGQSYDDASVRRVLENLSGDRVANPGLLFF